MHRASGIELIFLNDMKKKTLFRLIAAYQCYKKLEIKYTCRYKMEGLLKLTLHSPPIINSTENNFKKSLL